MKILISLFIALSVVSASVAPVSATSYREILNKRERAAQAKKDVSAARPRFVKKAIVKAPSRRESKQQRRDQATAGTEAMAACKAEGVATLDLLKCYREKSKAGFKEKVQARKDGIEK